MVSVNFFYLLTPFFYYIARLMTLYIFHNKISSVVGGFPGEIEENLRSAKFLC
jgi:hypothetical protein